MKKHFLFCLLAALLWCGLLNAQLTGTKNIPGDYANLDLAIQALNAQGVGAGGVTLNLLAGNPQTAPAGGYTITAQGTAANTIVISGNNNTITASSSLTAGALNDGIFKITGGDYITIRDFLMQENTANTVTTPASNNMTEWGVALLQGSTTNGSQHNTITGNTIVLNRAYGNSIAVYSNAQHDAITPTTSSFLTDAVNGPNSFNTITGNIINNVNVGVVLNGSNGGTSYLDKQNTISSNVISDFSGMQLPTAFANVNTNNLYGIYVDYENNYTISDNDFQTTLSTGGYDFRCIHVSQPAPGAPVTQTITRNSIAYTLQQPAGISVGIYSGGGPGNNCTMQITNNVIHDCSITSDYSMYGIFCTTASGITNITNNTFRNNSMSGEGSVYGIYTGGSPGGQLNINSNHIGDATGGAVTFTNPALSGSFFGIYNIGGTATTSLSITSNDFGDIETSDNTTVTFIQNTIACLSQYISGNTFTNISLESMSANVYFIANNCAAAANGTVTVNSNSIVGSFSKTLAGGAVYLYYTTTTPASPSTVSKTERFNNFSNISVNGSTSIYGWIDVEGNATNGPVKNISDNIFSNWNSGSGLINTIEVGRAGNGSAVNGNTISGLTTASPFFDITVIKYNTSTNGSSTISNNTIFGLNGTAGLTGIQGTAGTAATLDISGNRINGFSTNSSYTAAGIVTTTSGQTITVSKNKIYDLQSTTGQAYGIYFAGGSSCFASNNLIGNLRAINSSISPAVNGIIATNVTSADLNSNTIYLNATSTGSGFGTAGIYANNSVNLTLRNNLVVNLSTPNGSGRTVALRRTSSGILYNAASNNNSFYAGTPASNHLIYYDGVNLLQTISAFRTFEAPLDANSISANPTFTSTSGFAPTFLHIPAAAVNALESGGVAVPGFTTDYDNDTRPGPVGSLNGWGTAPDIGADEFDGVRGCAGTPTAGTASASPGTPVCGSGIFNLTLSGASEGPGIGYQWASATASGGPYTPISGATAATYNTGTISSTTYYVCIVSCSSSGLTAQTNEVTCTVNAIPATPAASSNSPACTGSTISLSVPAVPGATYAWTGPSSFSSSLQNPTRTNASAAMAGTYSVTVTVNGCTSSAGTTTVVVNAVPATPSPSSNSPVCTGNALNLSTTAVSGATYAWTGPSSYASSVQNPSQSNATLAMAGTYSLTVTVNGCTSAAGTTTVVVNPTPATPVATNNSPVCEGGTLNLSTAAVAGATYGWSGPNLYFGFTQNPSMSNVQLSSAGTYNVVVTVNGCTSASGSTNVVVNPAPATPTPSSNTPVCSGNALNLSTPAVAGATYSWTGPASFASTAQNPTLNNATAAMAGTYSVTVTANGCTSQTGFTSVVIMPTPAAPSVSIPSSVCAGSTLSMNAPFDPDATYAWTGPNSFTSSVSAPTITNVTTAASGTYSVTMTLYGCTSPAGTGTTTVNLVPATPAALSNSPVCTGNAINLSTATVSGATYAWTGPSSFFSSAQNPSRSNATTAMAGTYSVTVTKNGCTSPAGTTSVVVNTTPATPTVNIPPAVCEGGNLNINTAAVSGATYAWSGPNSFTSSAQITSIPNVTTAASGTYSVTVTTNGCTSAPGTGTTVVNLRPAAPVATGNSPVCTGNNINLSMSTVANASYTWADPSFNLYTSQNVTIPNATTAMAGTYNAYVTVNGCTSPGTPVNIVVNQTPATPTASGSATVCEGNAIALSTPSVAGATYAWTGPNSFTSSAQNPTISNASMAMAGTYSVTVTTNGCTSSAGTTSVIMNALPVVNANASAAAVCSGNAVTLSGSGAQSYSWNNSVTDNVAFIPPMTDTYIVTGTDANGCSNNDTISVTVNALPNVLANASSNIVCAGSPVTLYGSGATSYSWTGNVTDNVPFNLLATDTYTVTGTDANGCTNTDEITMYILQLPVVTATANDTVTCAGTNMMVSGHGASTYVWSGGVQNNVIFQPTTTMTYTVIGTDGSGCSDSATITIHVNPLPVVTINATATTVCYGTSVTLSGNGASTYIWQGQNTAVQDNVPFTAHTSDFYTVYGIDGNGCVATDTISLFVNPLPMVVASASASQVCYGENVTLSGSGAVSYSWSGGAVDNVAFAPVISDSYTVTGTGANGCQNTDQVFITVHTLPNVTANASATSVCSGSNVTLSGSGPGVVSFAWTGNVTDNAAFTPAATDTYIVTGMDNYGCVNNDTITITVNALPVVSLSLPMDTVCGSYPGTITLTGESPAGGVWSGTTVSGNTFDPYAAGVGLYPISYTYTDGNGCAASANDSLYVDVCAGTETLATSEWNVFPNPTAGTIVISTGDNASGEMTVEIYAVDGKLVRSEKAANTTSVTLDIANEPVGTYIIRITANQTTSVRRIVKI